MASPPPPRIRLRISKNSDAEGLVIEIESWDGPVAVRRRLGPLMVDEPLATTLRVEAPDPHQLADLRLHLVGERAEPDPAGDTATDDGRALPPWRLSRSAVRAVVDGNGTEPLELVPELGPRGSRLIELAPGSLDALDEPTRPHQAPRATAGADTGLGPAPPALVRHLRRELARARVQNRHLAARVAELSPSTSVVDPAGPVTPDTPTRRS